MTNSDSPLPDLKTQQERLQWARAKFFSSPRAAAEALDWPVNTYKSRESGIRSKRGLHIDDAKRYARAFKVPLEWLLTGARPGELKTGTELLIAQQAEGGELLAKSDARQKVSSHKSDNTTSPTGLRQPQSVTKRDAEFDSQEVRDTHNVPVVGYVGAGYWVEMADQGEVFDYVGVELPEFTGIELRAHRVKGTSVNRWFPEGYAVIYVPIPSPRLSVEDILRADDWVILRRQGMTGDFEITIKRLRLIEDGSMQFWPDSTDPQWGQPIVPAPRDDLAQEGIEIIGVVVDYRPPRLVRSPRSAYRL